jgi:hypothetical protein
VARHALGQTNRGDILSINMLGDLANVFVRHDYRGLIGVPVAGAMIFFLLACGRRPKSFRTR